MVMLRQEKPVRTLSETANMIIICSSGANIYFSDPSIKKQAGHTSLMTRLGQHCDDITYLTAVAQVCAWIMRLPQVFAHFWRRRLFVQLY